MHKHCAAKKYNATTDEKLQRGIWPGSGEIKLQRDNGQLAKANKITTRHWLPAGWLSCHVVIYFSAKNHNVVKFGQEPDALQPCVGTR